MPNMELITSVTVGSGGAASVTLPATGTIPQTYTDLKIVVSGRADTTTTGIDILFNGSSTSYSNKRLYGTGSSVASDSAATTYISNIMIDDSSYTASTFGNGEIYIPNYTSSNYKSVSVDGVSENNATTALMMLTAGLWSNTAAIILLRPNAGNFVQGSTFYLYGISNVTSGSKATGGIVSSDGTYWYHMFPYSGTFTPTQNLTADYLVIAGGGGGGTLNGRDEGTGGGGAGGLRSTVGTTGGGGSLESALSLTAQAYTVTVGAGGAPGGSGNNRGNAGSNSVFSTITSDGGGSGSAGWPDSPSGGNGGSGGGGNPVGVGTANQGFNGGLGGTTGNILPRGAGGGGAGVAGGSGAGAGTAAGGNGVQITTWATPTGTGFNNSFYAGGGGGGGNRTGSGAPQTGGVAGLGGGGVGGNGNVTTPTAGGNGIANTGGGGGGAGGFGGNNSGGAGGSGIVIIRYAI